MKSRSSDPLRLDVEAFAHDGGQLSGHWPLASMERLRDVQVQGADAADDVAWSAGGEERKSRLGSPEIWLHLKASTVLWLQCQRCLQGVRTPLEVHGDLRFVRGEEEAAALDAELDEDVLALTRTLDLRELIEDELLLSLPLVPRHDECPVPLAASAQEPVEEDAKPNPFAALAALRKTKSE